jgi:PKD repeat protein
MSSLQQLSTLPNSHPVDDVQIIGWNDYEAGSQIEAGVDNCVFITPTLAADTLSWQVTGNTDTIDHYAVFASTDGTNLTLIAITTPATNSLALGNLNLTAGKQYTMYVQAVGKPSVLNKISPPASYTPVSKQAPVIQLAVSPTSGIAPLAVSSSITSSGTIVSNSIDFGDGTIINSASGSHTYASAGTYMVKATATNNYGLHSTATATVNAAAANQPPVAKLLVTPRSGTAPVTVSASTAGSSDPNPSGTIASTTISFGDGTVVKTTSGAHAYTSAGTYTVTATVTDNLGLSSSATATVSVAAPQVVAVAVTPANASTTTGATQQFTASVTGTSNTAITWMVSGTGCGGTACGTISSTGLYTAPAGAPSPPTVTVTATSVADPTKSASAAVTIVPPAGATYYLAPAANGGNDSNSGLSETAPWLTPNHALTCGDVLQAAAGAYDPNNFYYSWGAVTCAAGNNVAWVKCATFDACTMSVTTSHGVAMNASYWGIQGFAITGNSSGGPCIQMYPNALIHHLIVANNVLVGCGQGGVAASNNGTSFSEDYLAIIGNIVYGTSGGSASCTSGISVYEPKKYDSLPGTHIYIAGNFSFANQDGNPCNGGAPTDGSGVILDTFDGSQGGLPAYDQQAVVENNLLIANGGRGITVYENNAGSGLWAHIYALNNTMWNNNLDANTDSDAFNCGELEINTAYNVEAYKNIMFGAQATGCHNGTSTLYAITMNLGDGSDHVYSNTAYAVSGSTTDLTASPGFSYGPNNLFGTDPGFANPVIPSAPSCGSFSSVAGCMAAVVADVSPSAQYQNYGMQPVQSENVYNPLFPQWLCNVNLPTGLVTPGCLAEPQ